ncbi:MAG: hypothetical protein AB1938_06690 [Myxococcota bacterium]
MAPALTALSLLVVHAASLSPSQVPATGPQEALLTLDAPAAIHLSARSGSGTRCEVIDRVRGPFASAGSAGSSNCELDLLLDAGQYKVRLDSSLRGKGQVALSATPFTELNATPVKLVPGSGVLTKLKAGQQASFWLSVKERHVPYLRISGRQAGDVRVWRNGEWLEPVGLHHAQFSPTPGQPLHEWWLDSTLEAGEYLVTAYGRDATTVTGSSVDDSLTVEYGFRAGPPERSVPFVLPPSGVFAVEVKKSMGVTAVLSLAAAPVGPVDLQALVGGVRGPAASCRIDKAALAPECITTTSADTGTVLLVRGPSGTRGVLEWSDYRSDASQVLGGGYYGPSTAHFPFVGEPGPHLLAVHDLPNDVDGVPLGCQLERLGRDGNVEAIVARSMLSLRDGEKLEREFNYDGSATFWFQVESGGNVFQKIGIASRKFNVTTSGGRKSNCEVYRIDDKGGLTRLTRDKTEGTECSAQLELSPGAYQLSLSGGLSGVEKVTIAPVGDASARATTARGGCLVPEVTLSADRYRLVLNRVGGVRVRGLSVLPLPLAATAPVHLQLDSGQTLRVPVSQGVVIRSSGGAPFGCVPASSKATATAGECVLTALSSPEMLTLSNPSATPLGLTLLRPGAMPPLSSPVSFVPTPKPLPAIAPDTPTFFDFERGQSHAATFVVDRPGLYHVTTQGLLNTECRLRTPVIPDVTSDRGGGRGRNCLIQTYLQPGRYLLSATTTGSSRGRAALFLTRRPVKEHAGLAGESEQFFRVADGELVQQRLTLKQAGQWTLTTTAQGVGGLQCRLDDPEGWPVEVVPSSCSGTRSMRAGTYLWTQWPLTVESMRHTQLQRVREEVVLEGNKAHAISFFTWYRARLGPDGKDEFTFTLEGETTLDVVLTGGMQGRVYRLEKDKPAKAVEVIPAMQPSGEGDSYEAEREGEGEAEEAPPPEYEGEGEYSEDGEYQPPQTAPVEVARAQAAPPPPAGVKITLPSGRYRLVTEHSRGDVGIEYQLHLGSATLLPGMTRTLPVPSTVPVLIPRDGTLRLRTEGEADVRCRLLDGNGRRVLEGSENGADWNCAVAEPVKQGRYTLVVESETQAHGETKLSLFLPPSDAKGPIADGQKFPLGAAVVTLDVPLAEKDSVHELTLSSTSKTPISCALEDGAGAVVFRLSRVGTCALLVRPKLEKFKVRVWTTDGSTQVATGYRSKPIIEGKPGAVPGESALAITLPSAGRYRTSPQVQCLPADAVGLLRACGPETSLEAGPTLFAVAGVRPQPLPLDEIRATASDASVSLGLSRSPFLQTVTASRPSLLLLEARVQHGERAAPSCAFDGPGAVRERRADACFAVAKVGVSAVSRLWAPVDERVEANVTRRAVPLPDRAEPLAPGRKTLSFPSGVGRFALPSGSRARLQATLPKGAWGVLLDDAGAALDLCAPTSDLSSCTFTGQGGSAVFVATLGQVESSTVLLESAPRAVAFTGFFEASPRQPGSLRFTVPAAKGERLTGVDGALGCTVVLTDGTRLGSCRVKIPEGSAAELQVEHGVGPLRVMVHTPGRERWARLGLELPVVPGPALSPSVAVPLQSGRLDRTLVVGAEAVVRVSAESGVCGLFRGNDLLQVDGLDTGCELARVLAPGTYRVLVRPFAGVAQAGTLTWTAEPVTQLKEGFGAEQWLAPGEARLFRFDTANRGKIGLGLSARSELLECAVFNDGYQQLGDGCQQYLSLDKGRFLLTVRNPPRPGATPIAFKPVLLGLSGERNDVPDEVIEDFKRRAGVTP